MVTLNIKIQELRKERALSVKNFAQAFHVTERTVQRWEDGSRMPTIETLVELAKFFGVSTDYLLGLED